MPRFVLAYDAECGPCTRFKRLVHFIDTRNQIDFISLIEADDSGLLDEIPKSERHTSFHIVFPGGEVQSGASAIPSLIEILPGGKIVSKVITSAPGGIGLISFVYAGFSRLHDRGSCTYQRSFAASGVGLVERVPTGPISVGPLLSRYLFAGLLGGFLGALAMGAVVPLPDALCRLMAADITGPSSGSYPLAWALHIATGVAFGAIFGTLASFSGQGGRRPFRRSILLGVPTGFLVWGGFFIPSLLILAPSLITNALLETSLAAHLIFGLVLGSTLGVMLSRSFAKLAG